LHFSKGRKKNTPFELVDADHGEGVTETENEGEAYEEHRHGEEGFRRIHGTQHAGKSKLFFYDVHLILKNTIFAAITIID
jgi:hypothetical protein